MNPKRETRWVYSGWRALVAAALAITVVTPASASGLPADDPIDDAFPRLTTDLPALIDGPTRFNVLAGNEICRMTYDNEVRTAPPWTFTYDPSAPRFGPSLVEVEACEGWSDYVEVAAQQAFEIGPRLASAERGPIRVQVRNNTAGPARVVITDAKGKVVVSRPARPGKSVVVFRSSSREYARRLTVTAEGAGHRSTVPLTVARGWNPYDSSGGTFRPCSTVPWSYHDANRPSGSSKSAVLRDISGAFARLGRLTGVRFVRSDKPIAPLTPGAIAVTWESMGSRGPLALGGAMSGGIGAGWIKLNRQHRSTSNDRTSGFGPNTSRGAARGWTLVHEAMHVLGMDHTSDRGQLMYPVATTQHGFGGGDLAGLRQLYPKDRC